MIITNEKEFRKGAHTQESQKEIVQAIELVLKRVGQIIEELPPLPEEAHDDMLRMKASLSLISQLLEKNFLQVSPELFDAEQPPKIWHDLYSQMASVQSYAEFIVENIQDITQKRALQALFQAVEEAFPLLRSLEISRDCPNKSSFTGLAERTADYGTEYVGYRALIIDDSPYNREILERRLRKYGLTVYQAENGQQGLEKLREQSVDLILLDIVMPGLNGYQVLERIKDAPETRHIPVLMIAAVHEVAAIVQCIQSGADDYLSIPFNPTILNTRVRTCLEKKRLHDQHQKKAEELWKIKNILQTVTGAIHEAFAMINRQGQIEMYNDAFANFHPIVRQNPLLSLDTLIEHYYEDRMTRADKDFSITDQREWLVNEEENWLSSDPYLIELLDGRRVEIRSYSVPDGYIMIQTDVTAAKG